MPNNAHRKNLCYTQFSTQISIETSVPQQAGGFIIKCCSEISNIAACREKIFSIGTLLNNKIISWD